MSSGNKNCGVLAYVAFVESKEMITVQVLVHPMVLKNHAGDEPGGLEAEISDPTPVCGFALFFANFG